MQHFWTLFFVAALFLSCGKGAHMINQNGLCQGYPTQSLSPHTLPYTTGESYSVSQGNCSPWSHSRLIRYAYDFDMPSGTNVRAIRDGTVVNLNLSYGEETSTDNQANFIEIQHADGSRAYYVHLKQNTQTVSLNQAVTQGSIIAQSGESGTRDPHLHLQVWKDARRTDTIPVLFRNTRAHPNGLVEGETYVAQ